MREILFRAWIKRAKCFCYSTVGTEYFPSFWYNLNTNPDDYVIMQYTGLKDKNGKRIFEGDIIKYSLHNIGYIFWHKKGYWAVNWKNKAYNERMPVFCGDILGCQNNVFSDFEKIGTKFQNPELSEGK